VFQVVPQLVATKHLSFVTVTASISVGKGVTKALAFITGELTKKVQEREFGSQREFDSFLCELDGTENKTHFGANTLLALSLAYGKAVAKSRSQEFLNTFVLSFLFQMKCHYQCR
jgi:enolase